MKRIILLFIFLFVFLIQKNGYCNTFTIGVLFPEKEIFINLVKGIKKAHPEIKIKNLLKENVNVDLILAYENYLEKATKFKKFIFAFVEDNPRKFLNISPFIKICYSINLSLKQQITYSIKVLQHFKKVGILLHEYNYLKKIRLLNFEKIKIFYVENIGEVPYKLNIALKKTDALIAFPDKTVFNYFSTQFIFKRAILNGKPIICFSKDGLELGAYAAILPDFFKEGVRISDLIVKFLTNKKIVNRIYYPSSVKIIKNKTLYYEVKN